jgi:hypothetical protein
LPEGKVNSKSSVALDSEMPKVGRVSSKSFRDFELHLGAVGSELPQTPAVTYYRSLECY